VDPLAFITALAQDAGALLRERLDDPRRIVEKRPHDLVTDADAASEALIVARIRAAFPRAAAWAGQKTLLRLLKATSGPSTFSGSVWPVCVISSATSPPGSASA